MKYDPDLEIILEAMKSCECSAVSVKGLNFHPFDEEHHDLLAKLAHSSDVREELIELRDMINDALVASNPLGRVSAVMQEAAA